MGTVSKIRSEDRRRREATRKADFPESMLCVLDAVDVTGAAVRRAARVAVDLMRPGASSLLLRLMGRHARRPDRYDASI
jgi:hypothetical protein